MTTLKLFTNTKENANFRRLMVNKGFAKSPMTKKQQVWLLTAIKEYEICPEREPANQYQASKLIEAISVAISQGKVAKRVAKQPAKEFTMYVVCVDANNGIVKIKKATGIDKAQACNKLNFKYRRFVELITDDIEEAKHVAKMFRNGLASDSKVNEESASIEPSPSVEEQNDVNLIAMVYESAKDLSVDDIITLCKDCDINIGRARTKTGIMKKLKAQL